MIEKRLHLSQKLEDPKSADWFEPARQTILFAYEAPARFRRGTPDEKRQLVTATAHSLVLRDRSLTALPQEPFRILATNREASSKVSRAVVPSGLRYTRA